MTASTLYEAIEPQLLWKHFLSVVFDEIVEGGTRFEVLSFGPFQFSSITDMAWVHRQFDWFDLL